MEGDVLFCTKLRADKTKTEGTQNHFVEKFKKLFLITYIHCTMYITHVCILYKVKGYDKTKTERTQNHFMEKF